MLKIGIAVAAILNFHQHEKLCREPSKDHSHDKKGSTVSDQFLLGSNVDFLENYQRHEIFAKVAGPVNGYGHMTYGNCHEHCTNTNTKYR